MIKIKRPATNLRCEPHKVPGQLPLNLFYNWPLTSLCHYKCTNDVWQWKCISSYTSTPENQQFFNLSSALINQNFSGHSVLLLINKTSCSNRRLSECLLRFMKQTSITWYGEYQVSFHYISVRFSRSVNHKGTRSPLVDRREELSTECNSRSLPTSRYVNQRSTGWIVPALHTRKS